LSRENNNLRISIGGISVADIPLSHSDQILKLKIKIPASLTSGVISVDIDIDNVVKASDQDERLIGIFLQECGFI